MMRKIISDFVPKQIVNRGKKGFTPPLIDWFTNNWAFDKNFYIPIKQINIDYYNEIKKYKTLELNNRVQVNYTIRSYIFNKWYEEWFKDL